MNEGRKTHWDGAYGRTDETRLGWYQDRPTISLELAKVAGIVPASSVIDIGGGASAFVDALIGQGLRDVTVLDLSQTALDIARQRLGQRQQMVTWIASDITLWSPVGEYDLWHDRAVFHFLVEPVERAAYLERLSRCVSSGGHAIIATFAPDGPETCSGLPVVRYSPESLADILGPEFDLVTKRFDIHRTPGGKPQSYQFSLFRKNG